MTDDNSEVIVLEVDDGPAVQGVGRANTALDSYSKKGVTNIKTVGKAFEEHGTLIVRTSDRSRNSVERLVAAHEKLSQTYGKSGVERLVAQRDQLIQRLNGEEQAVTRVRAAYDKMIQAEKSSGGSGFNARYAFFGAKDILEGRSKNAIAEVANELIRLRGVALAVGGGAIGIAAIGFAAYEVHKKLQEIAEQPEKIAAAFHDLNGSMRGHADQLRLENDRLADTIAKLEHKPRNLLAESLDEARVMADKLAESLNKDAESLGKLLKENGVGLSDRMFGVAGTSDVTDWYAKYQKAVRQVNYAGSTNVHNAKTQATSDAAQAEWDRAIAAMQNSARGKLGSMITETEKHSINSPSIDWLTGKMTTTTSAGDPANFAARMALLQGIDQNIVGQQDTAGEFKRNRILQGERDRAESQHSAGLVTEGLRGELAKARESELTDLQKINEAYREKVRHLYEEGQASAQNLLIARDIYDLEYAHNLSKESGKIFEGQVKHMSANLDYPGVPVFAQADMFAFDVRNVQGQYYAATMPHAMTKQQQADELISEQTVRAQVQKADDDRHIQGIGREAALQEHLLKLNSEPGGEPKLIEDSYRTRLSLAQQIYDIERRDIGDTLAGYKLIEEQDKARIQRTTELAEIHKRQFEEVSRTSAGLFNTLFTNPRSFGKQLSGTVRSSLLHPITEGLGNMTASFLTPVVSSIGGTLHGFFGGGGIQDVHLVNGSVPVFITNGSSSPLAAASGGFSSAASTFSRMAGGMPAMIGGEMIGGGGSTAGLTQLSSGLWRRGPSGGSNPWSPEMWNSPIFGAGSPGGTSGFTGPVGGGRGFGGFNVGGVTGMLKNFRGMDWGGLTRGGAGIPGVNGQPGTDLGGNGPITGVSGLAGAAMFTGGTALAQYGLLGNARGTTAGIFEGALGGAAAGFAMGGPIGAAIGGGVGLLVGIGEKIAGVETPEREAQRLIKSTYGMDIPSGNGLLKQVVAMSQQYGGSVSMTIRTPAVRQLLQLYAESTGQKSSLFLQNPMAAHLIEQGGSLGQSLTYNNGTGYNFGSGIGLPTLGNSAGLISTGDPYAVPGQMNFSLSINGQSAADALEGRVTSVANPAYVSGQQAAALRGSNGRLPMAGALLNPAVISA